jgi:alpha-N-arabinofuranosidase
VRQAVYLPVQRVLRYTGYVYVKPVSGPLSVEVSIRRRNHPDEVLARASLSASGDSWQKHEFELELQRGALSRNEPADFVIALSDGARALIDQAILYPADHVCGLDPEMVQVARDLRTPLPRDGGNFTSGYHWRDGIGPMDARVSMINQAWGMPEYNHFGTDEFLRFCRLIEAEPQICLNLGSGTPEEAAEWVEYVNSNWNDGRGGLLWELGNELWGDWQIGYPTGCRPTGRSGCTRTPTSTLRSRPAPRSRAITSTRATPASPRSPASPTWTSSRP